jgi:hypothetical protein
MFIGVYKDFVTCQDMFSYGISYDTTTPSCFKDCIGHCQSSTLPYLRRPLRFKQWYCTHGILISVANYDY